MKHFLFLYIVFLSLSGLSSEKDLYFKKFMSQFQNDSFSAMALVPPKFDRYGKIVHDKPKVDFQQKLKLRALIKNRSRRIFSGIVKKSQVENFFSADSMIVRKIEQLDDKNLLNATLKVTPWSGDYWPTYKGGIGSRYADPEFPTSSNFKDYYSVYQNFLPLKYDDQKSLDNLSAAEKYDILVGDESFSLTHWTFEDANDTYRDGGNKIESWFGLCHGWAAAAFMMARPESAVTYQVKNFQGHDIDLKFYPDDVKALSTLLWANTNSEIYFLGGRCNAKNPKQDANGRIIDEACFDVNPGAWHTAIINQLGINKSDLVIDVTYDHEIWNQPVVGYEVNYFHPQTKKLMNSLTAAMIPIEEITKDKFKSYRSPNARFIVGVNMTLNYVFETNATHAETNVASDDNLRSVKYIYDLELNEMGEIIGGEWYQNAHPDFLWAPDKRARAISVTDDELQGQWSENITVPKQWTKNAALSATYGQPLAAVVEGLIQRARSQ